MYKWMALAQFTCSLTNRAAKDLLWMPLGPLGPMFERRLLSGSPALHTLLSFSFRLLMDCARQTAPRNWFVAPHLPWHG